MISPNEGGVREPTVHQDIGGRGSRGKRAIQHRYNHLRSRQECFLTSLIAVRPFVDLLTHAVNGRFAGTEQREVQRQESMAVGPSHGEHAKALVISAGSMIFESGQQLDGFAAVALEHRIVNDEDGVPICRRKNVDLLHGCDAERRQKTTPGKACMVEETIDGILAGKGVALAALKQSKPILLVKEKDKDELKQPSTAKAESLTEPGLLKMFQHFQFLKSRL